MAPVSGDTIRVVAATSPCRAVRVDILEASACLSASWLVTS